MKNLPRIALVVPGLTQGGGVPAAASFIKDTIIRSGQYELKLISLSMSSSDPCSVNIKDPKTWSHGVTTSTGVWENIRYIHVGAFGGELEFQRYLPRRPLTESLSDCDIIQVVSGTPAWANAVCGLGKPVALQCATRARVERRRRDSQAVGLGGRWRKLMTEITDNLDNKALRSVDTIQVMNLWMLEYSREINIDRDVRIQYSPPGIDETRYFPLPERKPARNPYILCVGRLDDPRKNIELLLNAYAQLPKRLLEQTRLVLAGSAEPPKSFWIQANALGLTQHITFISKPDQDSLVSLYQNASVFVLPSDEEGLGIALLEAMACGVPSVATRSGGPDGIIHEGEDGFLVELGDAPGMSACIARLLSDTELNINLGRQARMTIDRHFSNKAAGSAFLRAWDQLYFRKAMV